VRVVEVRVEDLLGVGERAIESAAHNGKVLRHLLVVDEVAVLPIVLLDLRSNCQLRQSTTPTKRAGAEHLAEVPEAQMALFPYLLIQRSR
jgi:hypothetical protein